MGGRGHHQGAGGQPNVDSVGADDGNAKRGDDDDNHVPGDQVGSPDDCQYSRGGLGAEGPWR